MSQLSQIRGCLLVLIMCFPWVVTCLEGANIIGYWSFGEADMSNGKFTDRTGMGKDARLVHSEVDYASNFPLDSIGALRDPVALDGSGRDWIEVPCGVLDGKDSLALEVWFKWDGKGGDQQFIVGNASGVILALKEEGKLFAMIRASGEESSRWVYVESPSRVEVGVWQHALLLVDGEALKLVRIAEGVRGATLQESVWQPLKGDLVVKWTGTALGINPYGKGSPFSGSIAGFKIYDGAPDLSSFEDSKL